MGITHGKILVMAVGQRKERRFSGLLAGCASPRHYEAIIFVRFESSAGFYFQIEDD